MIQDSRALALLEQAVRVKDNAVRYFKTTVRRDNAVITVWTQIKKDESIDAFHNIASLLSDLDSRYIQVGGSTLSDAIYDLIIVRYPERSINIEVTDSDGNSYFSEYANSRPLHTIKI